MASFMNWILLSFYQVVDLIDNVKFKFGNTDISLLSLLLSLIIIAFVVSVFWKGAQR